MNPSLCRHCQAPAPHGAEFCCPGCAKAFALVHALQLDSYYLRRTLDPSLSLRPETEGDDADLTPFLVTAAEGRYTLYLFVEKLHCAACVWLIEQVLQRQENVVQARINMSTRRLVLTWTGARAYGNRLVALVQGLGYRLRPFDPVLLQNTDRDEEAFLLRCLAVAGFAAGNIMLLSVALWSSTTETMGMETRALFHWISGLIAMPAIVYAGQPFFRSAAAALGNRRTNVDVPISLALVLATSVSLYETTRFGEHAYFDSAVMLLFFLLVGRYLERRAKSRARQAAQQLLTMVSSAAKVVIGDKSRIVHGRDLQPGMMLEVAAGERIAADGEVVQGSSELDTSLITGESLPRAVAPGMAVFAGTLNTGNPLLVRITKPQQNSLLADIIRMMEEAEQKRSRTMRLADRVTRFYTPVVHLLALSAFAGWVAAGLSVHQAVLIATTVLIITCPCALALAVPVVQVIASGRLFRQGIFLKSGDALERLSVVDRAVFDKTGTLTLGLPELKNVGALTAQQYQLAASLAQYSRHPLSKALLRRYRGPLLALEIREEPGAGLSALYDGEIIRLGNRVFCGVAAEEKAGADPAPETWFCQGAAAPVRLVFEDRLRSDAGETVKRLADRKIPAFLFSGDRVSIVAEVARAAGIPIYGAELTPAGKMEELEKLQSKGHPVLMVGDGLNDAPALAAAHVSMSPASALDITQNAADIVFQGERLAPIIETIDTARKSQRIAKQNIAVSIVYNICAVPLAVMGHVTPLVAAIAMSSSSLIVILNSLRVKK